MDSKTILKQANLKITKARVLILGSLLRAATPLSVEMIGKDVGLSTINQVTIYRTIESLVRLNIVSRVDLRRDSIFYEINGGHHHHIVCRSCGLLEDFDICGIDELSDSVLKKSKKFTAIEDHSFELFGVCITCDKKAKC